MKDELEVLNIKNLCGPLPLPVPAYSGGQPTRQQLIELSGLQVGTVINLRPTSELSDLNEATIVRELGMDYVHIPIADKTDLTSKNVQSFAAAVENSRPPLFIHCAGGNRVGAMVALMASWVGRVDADRALAMGMQSGLAGLREEVVERLG